MLLFLLGWLLLFALGALLLGTKSTDLMPFQPGDDRGTCLTVTAAGRDVEGSQFDCLVDGHDITGIR